MLVLRRKLDQTIILSHPALTGDITITIAGIECNGTRIKIGIDAPHSVMIAREELLPWTTEKPDLSQKGV